MCGLKEVLKCLNFRLCHCNGKRASCAVSSLASVPLALTAMIKVKTGIWTCHQFGHRVPLSCFFHSILCPASYLVFYYMLKKKKLIPNIPIFIVFFFQELINLIRKQNRIIGSTVRYIYQIFSPEIATILSDILYRFRLCPPHGCIKCYDLPYYSTLFTDISSG